MPPKESTTPGAALNTDRARRAHKNGHCRYSLSLRGNLVEKGLGTGSAEMEWRGEVGGVGPGLARPRWGGRTEPRGLRVGRAAPRVLRALRVWP